MLVSVIVPTYKPSSYIYECLDSLFRQTLDNNLFEILIVLNGCEEPYLTMINEYVKNKKSKIKVRIIHTDIPSVSNARNLGIIAAEGEYITFIDDDDWVSDNYLQNLIERSKFDCLTAANVVLIDSVSHEPLPYFLTCAYAKCSKLSRLTFFNARSFLSSIWCKLIPRSVIEMNRFDTKHKLGQDSLFMFQISRNIKHITLASPDTIYYVRKRQDSASHRIYSYSYRVKVALSLSYSYIKIFFNSPSKYSTMLFLTRIAATMRKLFQKRYER